LAQFDGPAWTPDEEPGQLAAEQRRDDDDFVRPEPKTISLDAPFGDEDDEDGFVSNFVGVTNDGEIVSFLPLDNSGDKKLGVHGGPGQSPRRKLSEFGQSVVRSRLDALGLDVGRIRKGRRAPEDEKTAVVDQAVRHRVPVRVLAETLAIPERTIRHWRSCRSIPRGIEVDARIAASHA
jgi:hypothetical protein